MDKYSFSDDLATGSLGALEVLRLSDPRSNRKFVSLCQRLARSRDSSLFSGTAGIVYSRKFQALQKSEQKSWFSVIAKSIDSYPPELVYGTAGILLAFLKTKSADAEIFENKLVDNILSKIKHGKSGSFWLADYKKELQAAYDGKRDLSELELPVKSLKHTVNLGFAHGLGGTLFVLSQFSLLSSYRHREILSAVNGLAKYLLSMHQKSPENMLSPYAFAHEPGSFNPNAQTQQGWCYGNPGMSLSLLWAGKALKDKELTAKAEEIFFEWNQHLLERGLENPYFCHGSSGLADICRFFYKETRNDFAYLCWLRWIEETKNLVSIRNSPPGLLNGNLGVRAVNQAFKETDIGNTWSCFLGTSEI